MNLNVRPTEQYALLDSISPQQGAVGNVFSTAQWIDVSKCHQLLAILQTGVLGASATVDFNLQQATDASGTGVKTITGKQATTIVKASGDNVQVEINLRPSEMDVEGGFRYVRVRINVGVAASFVSAVLLGATRYGPANSYNAASVAQVLS